MSEGEGREARAPGWAPAGAEKVNSIDSGQANDFGEKPERSRVRERSGRTGEGAYPGGGRPRSGIGDGEFDPGSERTLAARLKHASRANGRLRAHGSGGRVSNTWVTCPPVGNSTWKHVAIPHERPRMAAGRERSLGTAGGWARGPLASWRGKGPPRRRWVAGLRGWTATLGLRTAQTPTGGSS